jgi:hypothetical protein
MATQDDVRRIALALPGVVEEAGSFGFDVAAATKQRHIVWAWRERIHPKKSRVPSTKVVAIRVANELEKQALLSADERKFFTEPHYDGYPAVLVNLEEVTAAELEPLFREAWRCRAPKQLQGEATSGPRRPVAKPERSSASKKPAATKRSNTPTKRTAKRSSASKKPAATKRSSAPTKRTAPPPRSR